MVQKASYPDFLSQLKALITNLSPAKRVVFLLVVAGVVAGFIIIISWSTSTEFGVLYKNLSPEDAGLSQCNIHMARQSDPEYNSHLQVESFASLTQTYY